MWRGESVCTPQGFDFDEVRAVAIEDSVAKVTGVCAVYAYPRTESVVIFFSPESRNTDAVLSAIADARRIPCRAGARPCCRTRSVCANPGVVQTITGGIRRLLSRSPDGDEESQAAGKRWLCAGAA